MLTPLFLAGNMSTDKRWATSTLTAYHQPQKKILEKQKKIEIYVFLWFIFFYAYTKVAFFAPLPFHALAEQRTHISTAHFHILLFQLWLLVC